MICTNQKECKSDDNNYVNILSKSVKTLVSFLPWCQDIKIAGPVWVLGDLYKFFLHFIWKKEKRKEKEKKQKERKEEEKKEKNRKEQEQEKEINKKKKK